MKIKTIFGTILEAYKNIINQILITNNKNLKRMKRVILNQTAVEEVAMATEVVEHSKNGLLGLLTFKWLTGGRRQRSVYLSICSLIFLIAAGSIFYACNKDNELNTTRGKFNANVTTNYPFVLPEAMQPYQYAVYTDDILMAFDYIQTVFDNYQEGDETGYFTFSSNTANTLLCYGFITVTSSHYDPNAFIDDPDNPFINIDDMDDDEPIMYATKKIVTTNEKKAAKWARKQLAKGNNLEVVDYNKTTKEWTIIAKKPDNWIDPFQKK